MRTRTTHAPSANFDTPTSMATTPVVTAPIPLMSALRCQPRTERLAAPPLPDHPGLAQGERDEDPDRVQRDESRHAAAERDDERHGDGREDHDAPVEREPIPAKLEHPGQEGVARQDAAQAREVGEGGVRGEDEQDRGGSLDEEMERRAGPHERSSELAQHRLLLGRVGQDAELADEEAHAQEDDPEEGAHDDDHPGCIARLRRLERRDAVGDRFDASQRDRSGCERAQEQQHAERLRRPDSRARRRARGTRAWCRWRSATARTRAARRSTPGRHTSGT